MIADQNGVAVALTLPSFLEFLDVTATGAVVPLDNYGCEVGTWVGSVTDMSPFDAALLARTIRAGLAQQIAASIQPVDHEAFAAAVLVACQDEADFDAIPGERAA